MKKLLKRGISAIIHWRENLFMLKLRIRIIAECLKSRENEKLKIAFFLLKPCKIPFFPYNFTKKYCTKNISVYYDADQYPYVIHNGKRLYFKKGWDEEKARKYYVSLQWDQAPDSPHCYLQNSERYPETGDIIVDAGAAEGVFVLDIIDIIEKAYLIECDKEWEIPLKKTFSKWRHKIEIVQKYIGDRDDGQMISLDTFFYDKKVDVLKADIEGAEEAMLLGGGDTFKNKVKKAFICTYHSPNAEDIIKRYLEDYGFQSEFNSGYTLYVYDLSTFMTPYVRHALIYGYHK